MCPVAWRDTEPRDPAEVRIRRATDTILGDRKAPADGVRSDASRTFSYPMHWLVDGVPEQFVRGGSDVLAEFAHQCIRNHIHDAAVLRRPVQAGDVIGDVGSAGDE